MHDIERELIDASSYKVSRKFANRQDYLGSILNAALKMPEEDFEGLSDEAADWYNAAVTARNGKNIDLPDFDEVSGDTESGEEAELPQVEATEEGDAEPPVEKPVKGKKTPPKKPASVALGTPEEDVVLDKWGAMDGSKNSQALAMFEKGATAKEVKDALGGTYYNILKKMVEKGHKLEKEGALMKLTHQSDLGAKGAKKKK